METNHLKVLTNSDSHEHKKYLPERIRNLRQLAQKASWTPPEPRTLLAPSRNFLNQTRGANSNDPSHHYPYQREIRGYRSDSDHQQLQQNLANMKQYITDLNISSKHRNNNANTRGYSDIKGDLISLHRRQSLMENGETAAAIGCEVDAVQNQVSTIQHHAGRQDHFSTQSNHIFHYNPRTEKQRMVMNRDGSFRLNGVPHHFSKDYIQMAKNYKRMEPYRCDSPSTQNACLNCQSMVFKTFFFRDANKHRPSNRTEKINGLSKVFFPCEHLCVCDRCFTDNGPWDICPLCSQNIKVIFDHTGKEKEDYWRWVNEIRPPLNSSFRKAFPRLSRKAIAVSMARSIEDFKDSNSDSDYDNLEEHSAEFEYALHSKACVIS